MPYTLSEDIAAASVSVTIPGATYRNLYSRINEVESKNRLLDSQVVHLASVLREIWEWHVEEKTDTHAPALQEYADRHLIDDDE